ncbi:peptidase S8/S53 domain-containing protein [Cercophora newfieldiana]|uniref:Peptidase S8/S53 domain-containing protein n=1 Tax=Cercophora newfieldiana TaxID=92897 RepID=A0AA39Y0P8_9PEZI|nr:peptidase S8/S53 domain-containing protein [Cercophora newfieldiana]
MPPRQPVSGVPDSASSPGHTQTRTQPIQIPSRGGQSRNASDPALGAGPSSAPDSKGLLSPPPARRRGRSASPASNTTKTTDSLENRENLTRQDFRRVLVKADRLREDAAKYHIDPTDDDKCPGNPCSHKAQLFSSAEEILGALLWDNIKRLPADDSDILLAKEHLAAAYYYLRDYPQAEDFYREVLTKRAASRTATSVSVARARRNLAKCLGEGLSYNKAAMTKKRSAKEIYVEALDLSMKNINALRTADSVDDLKNGIHFCRELEEYNLKAIDFTRLLTKRISALDGNETGNFEELLTLRLDLMRVYTKRLHSREKGEAIKAEIIANLDKLPTGSVFIKHVRKEWKDHEESLVSFRQEKWKGVLSKVKRRVQKEILPKRRREREIRAKWFDISMRLLKRRQRWHLVLTHAKNTAKSRIKNRRTTLHRKWRTLVRQVMARRQKACREWKKAIVFVRIIARWKTLGAHRTAQRIRAAEISALSQKKIAVKKIQSKARPQVSTVEPEDGRSFADTSYAVVAYDAEQCSGNDRQLRESADWIRRLVEFRKSILGPGFDAENVDRVRVTVIDSGLDDTHPFIQRQCWKRYRPAIKKGETPVPLFKDFTTSDTNKQHIPVDETGHGTFIAGLILQLAPDVELSVARISVDTAPGKPRSGVEKQIAAAIDHAVDVWKAEIISMSFGMDERPLVIREALQRAYFAKTSMFGAAGNFGNDDDVSFPASSEYVFKVFAATSKSAAADISPPPTPDISSCFAILGCDVKSIWPSKLKAKAENARLRFGSAPQDFAAASSSTENDELWTTMSGTSFATPILVSLVAMLYQFYNANGSFIKLGKDSHGFKSPQAMKVVLQAMSRPSGRGDKYNYLHPQLGRNNSFRHDAKIYSNKMRWFAQRLQQEIVAMRV